LNYILIFYYKYYFNYTVDRDLFLVELVFDSSGRPFGAGSLDGTITSLGDYDQCLSIETDSRTDPMFVGQYCILKYKLALPPKPKHLTLQSKVFNFTGTPIHGTVS
jgi:hypothetical protein